MQPSDPKLDQAPPQSPSKGAGNSADVAKSNAGRKFHNGWTKSLEELVAEWADKSSCYQWMHQKTEVKYQRFNMYFTIPVIIMSTLTGTANFATDSVVESPEHKKLVTFGIGAISLIAGIISTVANFLRYAQGSEAHRVAAISWGKFQRFISIELSLHPNERMDAMSFLKMGRVELDRLIEQSPPIPPKIIAQFTEAFKDKTDIKRPEIAGGVEHTYIFEDRDSRLAKVASEAAYIIQQKKGLMRQLVLEDIDRQIVRRTREEREIMEEELRHEIIRSAKETALAAMRNPTVNYAVKTFKNPQEEINRVVKTGTVERVKEKFTPSTSGIPEGAVQSAKESFFQTNIQSRLNETGGGYTVTDRGSKKYISVASGIALAAAQIAAAKYGKPEATEETSRIDDVKIEIIEDDEEEYNSLSGTGRRSSMASTSSRASTSGRPQSRPQSRRGSESR
jgi:hypothetical protein